jgi:flagellar basal-body rod protein FlgF
MAGGEYTALSGLRARIEQLDRLAADIANVGTAGYKAERTTSVAAERPTFAATLQTAIDVAPGPGRADLRPGPLQPTGRDLDFAIDGRGFFVIDTAAGPRYTRNGQFTRRADGTLTTLDDLPVLGESGPIRLGPGAVTLDADGTLRAGGLAAGRLRVVDFGADVVLARESAGRFRAPDGVQPEERPPAVIRARSLEGSNVSLVERMAQLTEVARGFEALQRGISILMNEVDGKAIAEFGRR